MSLKRLLGEGRKEWKLAPLFSAIEVLLEGNYRHALYGFKRNFFEEAVSVAIVDLNSLRQRLSERYTMTYVILKLLPSEPTSLRFNKKKKNRSLQKP